MWTPAAYAWSWPVQGPVLQAFVYDEAHPYASGQHRGIDIGADAAGETVVAPASGTISFAGTVPTNGKSVTIETPDGYAVTLTHLGSILVSEGAAIAEGDSVGTIGPSGTPEVDGPYVHLGIRVVADPNGYLDPLTFLPGVTAESPPTGGDSNGSQPAASGGSSAAPASEPAPVAAGTASPATTRGSAVRRSRGRVSQDERGRAPTPRAEARPHRSTLRPAAHAGSAGADAQRHARKPQRRGSQSTSSLRRPAVEAVAPDESSGLDAGHELRPSARGAVQLRRPRRQTPSVLLPLLANGAAALVALAAALAAACRRRRGVGATPLAGADVLELPRPAFERRTRRAA